MKKAIFYTLMLGLAAGCSREPETTGAQTRQDSQRPLPISAMPKIEADQILAHIKTISADEYEGRAPGGKGEELTVQYLEAEFKKIGLKPGNPDGTYIQKVPLVGITGAETQPFTVTGPKAAKRTFKYRDEVVAFTQRVTDTVSINNSELVFAGYGVTAPEYNWDDFKDVDVKGKTIIVLVNDPQVPDAADAAKLDDKLFNGKAMTYYGVGPTSTRKRRGAVLPASSSSTRPLLPAIPSPSSRASSASGSTLSPTTRTWDARRSRGGSRSTPPRRS